MAALSFGKRDVEEIQGTSVTINQIILFLKTHAGECFWDVDQGLDREKVYGTNADFAKKYIISQIYYYFYDKIADLKVENIKLDKRKLSFDINITDINGETEGVRVYL